MTAALPGLRRIDGFALGRWDADVRRAVPFGRDRVMVEASNYLNVRLNAAGLSDRRVLADTGPSYATFFHRVDDDTIVSINDFPGGYVSQDLVAGIWKSDDHYGPPPMTRYSAHQESLYPTLIFDHTRLPSQWDADRAANTNSLSPRLDSLGDFWRRGDSVYGTVTYNGSYDYSKRLTHTQTFLIRFQIASDGHTIVPDLDFVVPLCGYDTMTLGQSFPLDSDHFAVFKAAEIPFVDSATSDAVNNTLRVYDYAGNLVHETAPLHAQDYQYNLQTGVQSGTSAEIRLAGCRDGSIAVRIALVNAPTGGHYTTDLLIERLRWNGSGFDTVAQRQIGHTEASRGSWVESFYEFAPNRFVLMYVLATEAGFNVSPEPTDLHMHVQVLDGSLSATHEYVAPTKNSWSEITSTADASDFYSLYSQDTIAPVVTLDGNGYFGWTWDDEFGDYPSYDKMNTLFTFSLDGIGTETDPPIKEPQTRLKFGPQLGGGEVVGCPPQAAPTTQPLVLGGPSVVGPPNYQGVTAWPNPQAIYGTGSLSDGSDVNYVKITAITDPTISQYGQAYNHIVVPVSWGLPKGSLVKAIRWTARVSATHPQGLSVEHQDFQVRLWGGEDEDGQTIGAAADSVSLDPADSSIHEISGTIVPAANRANIIGSLLSGDTYSASLSTVGYGDDGSGTYKAQGTWTLNLYELTLTAEVFDPSPNTNPWNDTDDSTYIRFDSDAPWNDGITSVVALPPKTDWHQITRIDIAVKARSTVVPDPGRESYDLYLSPIDNAWDLYEESMTRVEVADEVTTWSVTLTDEVMRNVTSDGYYLPQHPDENGHWYAGPMSGFEEPQSLESVAAALVDGITVEVYPNYGVVDILDVEFKVFLTPTIEVNNAHHGGKVLRYKAGPVPPSSADTPTDQIATYNPEMRDVLAWDGGDWYLYYQETGNGTFYSVQLTDEGNERTGYLSANGVFSNFCSNFVQPGFVPVRVHNQSTGTYQMQVLSVGPSPSNPANTALTAVSKVDLPNPTYANQSTTPAVQAMAVPRHGGKVYVFTKTSSATLAEVWVSTVNVNGQATAFTKLGNLTVPTGHLNGAGYNYLIANLSDLGMISDRLGWSYNTQTLWDAQNPLVLIDGMTKIPPDSSITPSVDFADPNWGTASAGLLKPNHLLLFRRDDPETHSKVVEVEFSPDGSSATIINSWDTPIPGAPYSMSYATIGGAVAPVVTFMDQYQQAGSHVFYDIFANPQELNPTNPGARSAWSNLAPTPEDGWMVSSGGGYTVRQRLGKVAPPVVVPPTTLTIHGPATPEQGDSAKHRGMFAIDRTGKTISAQVQVGCDDRPIWVQPYANYFTVDTTSVQPVGEEPIGQPVQVPAGAGWTQVDLLGEPRSDATHWVLELRMGIDREITTRLPPGTEVFFDCIYVPDNGLSLVDQPYLDGDQPGAIWEGQRNNSTSIYGIRPPLSQQIVLDDDLPVIVTPDPVPDPLA